MIWKPSSKIYTSKECLKVHAFDVRGFLFSQHKTWNVNDWRSVDPQLNFTFIYINKIDNRTYDRTRDTDHRLGPLYLVWLFRRSSSKRLLGSWKPLFRRRSHNLGFCEIQAGPPIVDPCWFHWAGCTRKSLLSLRLWGKMQHLGVKGDFWWRSN